MAYMWGVGSQPCYSYTTVPDMVRVQEQARERERETEVAYAILQNFGVFSLYSPTLDALLVFVRIRYPLHNANI
jgi:hypothetical protein